MNPDNTLNVNVLEAVTFDQIDKSVSVGVILTVLASKTLPRHSPTETRESLGGSGTSTSDSGDRRLPGDGEALIFLNKILLAPISRMFACCEDGQRLGLVDLISCELNSLSVLFQCEITGVTLKWPTPTD